MIGDNRQQPQQTKKKKSISGSFYDVDVAVIGKRSQAPLTRRRSLSLKTLALTSCVAEEPLRDIVFKLNLTETNG